MIASSLFSLTVSSAGQDRVAYASEVNLEDPKYAVEIPETSLDGVIGTSLPVTVSAEAPSLARGLTPAENVVTPATISAASGTPEKIIAMPWQPPADLVKYTLPAPKNKPNTFTTSAELIPNSTKAIARAMAFVGNAKLACEDGQCYQLCDHLAGDIWGYTESSGYYSAKTHWATAVSQGIAHPGDKNPPLGALLFFDNNPEYGHVATYVGNGMVVSNWQGSPHGNNVYLMHADATAGYLGWAYPVFHNGEIGEKLN